MASPHDKLFKLVFGEREHAAILLERFLPPDLGEALAFEDATVCPGTFVDEALRDRHTDLLIEVPARRADADDIPSAFVYGVRPE